MRYCLLDGGGEYIVTTFLAPQPHDENVVAKADDDPMVVAFDAGETPPRLTAYAELRSDAVEAAGYAWQGHTVLTDAESQRKLAAERLAVVTEDRHDGDPWVMADGAVPLTNAQISAIATGVRAWVKGLTVARETLKAEIAAGVVTTKVAVDAAYAAVPMG